MPPQDTTLHRFKAALSAVYGPVDGLTASDAATWNPPTEPGAGGHRGRYLWTDAFGVLDLLTLYRATSSSSSVYLALARRLADVVHETLGRERDAPHRRLPGATDAEPLRGGLRIGKLDAAGPDGDGQYHHYLTLWMFALNRLSVAAREPRWNDLAVQLARAVHPHFVLRRPRVAHGRRRDGDREEEEEEEEAEEEESEGPLRMVWKVSMDLRRVLVGSEGHLDAATGYVVYSLLQRTAASAGQDSAAGPVLAREVADYARLMRRSDMAPSWDALDLGMGLWVCQFVLTDDDNEDDVAEGGRRRPGSGGGGGAAAAGVAVWARRFTEEALGRARVLLGPDSRLVRREASRRLAFREFGTCLGVRCTPAADADEALQGRVRGVLDFWERHEEEEERDLRPISKVMYAAALMPGAFRKGFLDDV